MDEKDTLYTFNELQTALHFLLWIWRNEISILQQAPSINFITATQLPAPSSDQHPISHNTLKQDIFTLESPKHTK